MNCRQCGKELAEGAKWCPDCGTSVGVIIDDEGATLFDLQPKLVLGDKFELIRRVGQGGMGDVWLARDTQLNEDVALKVLKPDLVGDKRAIADLKREVSVTRKLTHPNIVRVHDFHESGGVHFISMEYVDGESLADALAGNGGPFKPEEVLSWAGHIASALDYAHSEDVLHRDVKPGNMLLSKDGKVKLADFGIARVAKDTQTRVTGQVSSGTLLYMSPEQLMGDKLDSRSDLYGLGASLYELLSGNPPFHTGSVTTQIQLKAPSAIDGLVGHANESLLKALAKKPGERQSLCKEFVEDLSGESAHRAEREQAEQTRRELAHMQAEREAKERKEELERQAALEAELAKHRANEVARRMARTRELGGDRTGPALRLTEEDANDHWRKVQIADEKGERALKKSAHRTRSNVVSTAGLLCLLILVGVAGRYLLSRTAPVSDLDPDAFSERRGSNGEERFAKVMGDARECQRVRNSGGSSKAYVLEESPTHIDTWREAAIEGVPEAQCLLGLAYHYGAVVSQDDAEAVKWFRKAAEQGNAMGQVSLGMSYMHGEGVTQDEGEAVKWFRKGAEQGDARGQFELGMSYMHGEGVTQDEGEAVKWFRKAAEQGDVKGQLILGAMHENGRGVAQSDAEAVKWYHKAAEQGNAMAQVNLGAMYARGAGVNEDRGEAAKWFRKSAEQGNAMGQGKLGMSYMLGEGVTQDGGEAVKWSRKAAEQGDADGQAMLGLMYEKGIGVLKSRSKAMEWYKKSASQGNEMAFRKLENLGVRP